MTQSNTGRIYFDYLSSPSAPHVVNLGVFSSSGVKDITLRNLGLSFVWFRGRVVSPSGSPGDYLRTSPDSILHPGESGTINLTGSVNHLIALEFYKRYDPWYISFNDVNNVANDRIGVVEIEDTGS